jgi:hypothetical protein
MANLFEYTYQKRQLESLNLDNPIFVMYVNIEGLSTQRAHEEISQIVENYRYKNVTMWVIPTNYSKIECVYDGRSKSREMELIGLIKEINTRIDLMSNSVSFDDFKINIRDWRIDNIINGTEEK